MTKIRDQKGAITMITLITVLFLVSFLMSTYIIISNKVKTQKEMLNETKSIYEPKVTMEEIYNSYFSNDALIPIYTVNQLLAIGNGEKINIDGKIYTFTSNKVYILKNNLEFSVKDLGLETDWIPTYNSENIEWNGHTIKVTTLNENVITYSENTIIGYPITLADTKESVLADYRIYGNSIQNGTPTPTSTVEIQSVWKTKNLFNINAITNNKFTINDNSASVYIYASNSSQSTSVTLADLCPSLEVGKTYIINYLSDTNDSNISIGSYSKTNFWVSGTSRTITESDLNTIVRFGGGTPSDTGRTIVFSNIQVEESNVVTEYEPYGKYGIPIKVSSNTGEEKTYNIYIDEPLRKVGKYVDYIDFANQQIVRNVEVLDNTGTLTIEESYQGLETPKIESIELPKVQLYKGINKITIGTDVQPSNMSITYNVKQ